MSRRTRALQARTKETLNEVRSTKTDSGVEILENTQLLVEESGTIDDRRKALDAYRRALELPGGRGAHRAAQEGIDRPFSIR